MPIDLSSIYNAGKSAALLLGHTPAQVDVGWTMIGGYSAENQQKSYSTQIGYEQYLRRGYERALNDWNKNVGSQGRTIRYPELSYPGQIARSDTSIARNEFDYSNAGASYVSNFPYRGSGLYRISSKLSRSL